MKITPLWYDTVWDVNVCKSGPKKKKKNNFIRLSETSYPKTLGQFWQKLEQNFLIQKFDNTSEGPINSEKVLDTF